MARKKKGQLSIETLLIYGTVLLVATLAISALVYFGVLDLGGLLPDKCQLGSEVACENYLGVSATSTTDATLQFEFRNQIGKNIEIVGLTVTGEEDWGGFVFENPASTSIVSISETTPLSVNNGELSEAITVTSGDDVSVGQKFKGRIVVNYKVRGSEISQAKTGTLLATFT